MNNKKGPHGPFLNIPYLEGLVGFTITGLVVGLGLPQPHPFVTLFMS